MTSSPHPTHTNNEAAMLILTCRIGEAFRIGDHIKPTVIAVSGNQIRLGIKAPKEVSVHRSEAYETVRDEAVAIMSI